MPEFIPLAHGQRAHRFLLPDPVPEDLIERILDVATKAPSSQNSQPWEFVVVQDAARRSAIAEYVGEVWEKFARERSRAQGDKFEFEDVDAWATGALAKAPVMIVVCGDTGVSDASHLGSSIFPAVQNILLAALDLGLGSLLSSLPTVPRSLIDAIPDAVGVAPGQPEDLVTILGLPDRLVPLALIPIGYPAKTLGPPRRVPFAAKTHRESYGTPWAVSP